MTEKVVTRFELLMDAGNGAQKAGDILVKSLAQSGRYVFIEPIIPAEISPPKRTPHSMSGVVIRVANEDLTNIGSHTDVMVVEHEILLKRRLEDKEYAPHCVIYLDMGNEYRAKEDYAEAIKMAEDHGLTIVPFSIDERSEGLMKEMSGNGKNMFYLGLIAELYGVPHETIEKLVKETFKKLSEEVLDKNIAILEDGFTEAKKVLKESFNVPHSENDREEILLDGNLAFSLGIIDAGIRFFSGYPITPASTIMHNLAKNFASYGGIFHQAEDEISAIGAVVGAYYAGTPSITATSGPGLSLKQEFIGFASSSEIPLMVIDVQRGGPSTGLPTRTEQSDLFAAAFGSHGDSTKVVLSVANVEDCFYAPHVARYLTETLKVPVMIMSDYLTSVSYKVIEKLKLYEMKDVKNIEQEVLDQFYLNKLPDGIEMVKDNQSIPGEPERMRRLTGLNTDNEGKVNYTAKWDQRSHTVRNEKIHHVRRALQSPEIIGDDSGDILIVGWGSSRGVMIEAVEKAKKAGINVSALHLKIVYPLPLMLKDIFAKFKKVLTIEVAYGDDMKHTPFATLLRSETLVDIECGIAQATGRPMKPTQVVDRLREVKL